MKAKVQLVFRPARLQLLWDSSVEGQVRSLIAEFERPTKYYDRRLHRMVSGGKIKLIHKDGTFRTGLVWAVLKWWFKHNRLPVCVYIEKKHGSTVPVLKLVAEIVTEAEVNPTINRLLRRMCGLSRSADRSLDIDYRPHQVKGVDVFEKIPRGIWRCAVNAGKTYMAGMLCERFPNERILITVPYKRSFLAVQGYDAMRYDMRLRDVGLVKGSELSGERIVWAAVSTLLARLRQNRRQTLNWLNTFGVLIKDECHEHTPAEQRLYDNMWAWARLGMSGEPFRKDSGYDAVTVGCFGPVIYRVTNSYLVKHGYSAEPHVFMYRRQYRKFDPKSYRQFHDHIVASKERNEEVVRVAVQLSRAYGHRVVISTGSVNPHAKTLVRMLKKYGTAMLYYGPQQPKERKQVMRLFAQRRIEFLVGSNVFEVGVSEDAISAIIIAGPIGKQTTHVRSPQILGRGMRFGKSSRRHLVLVDFADMVRFGTGQANRRLVIWKSDKAITTYTTTSLSGLLTLLDEEHLKWGAPMQTIRTKGR